jgi:tRNA (guanine37-N1)-methyltransferase
MIISILTLFPDMFTGPFGSSIVKRAREKGLAEIKLYNIRDYSSDAYKTVDDHPFGGGSGMILRVDVVDRCLSDVLENNPSDRKNTRIILPDPQGKPFVQSHAKALSEYAHLIFIAAHYEGIDERIRELADEEISIGDYILTGGELPAMVITDAVIRLLPGSIREGATGEESFSDPALLEYPQYTRPRVHKGIQVPDVLLSGNHDQISQWRKKQATERTAKRRPDLKKQQAG